MAVFGSSEPAPDSPLYRTAREIGGLLADRGFTVITGGYGGVMEGRAGAPWKQAGKPSGCCATVFSRRSANRYVQESIRTADLLERTRILIENSMACIVLHGKAGTLAELTLLWALHRAGCLESRPVVLLGDGWRRFMDTVSAEDMLDPAQMEITTIAASPENAMEKLEKLLEE